METNMPARSRGSDSQMGNESRYPTYGNPHVTPQRWNDAQYGAAFLVFAGALNGRPFGLVVEDGIDKAALLSAGWSYSEDILVRAALDLFDPGCVQDHGQTPAAAWEILYRLDAGQRSWLEKAGAVIRGEATALAFLATDPGVSHGGER